jgi:hypothetical protein
MRRSEKAKEGAESCQCVMMRGLKDVQVDVRTRSSIVFRWRDTIYWKKNRLSMGTGKAKMGDLSVINRLQLNAQRRHQENLKFWIVPDCAGWSTMEHN